MQIVLQARGRRCGGNQRARTAVVKLLPPSRVQNTIDVISLGKNNRHGSNPEIKVTYTYFFQIREFE